MNIRLAVATAKLVQNRIADHQAPAAIFREVIAFASARHKSPVWKEIARIDIAEDLDRLTRSLSGLLEAEPPPKSINGLWFGINEGIDGKWCLYVCGSRTYSKGKEDWACRPSWLPKRQLASSQALKQLSTVGREDFDTVWIIEVCAIFSFGALAVSEAVRRIDPRAILSGAKKRGIGYGFNDGGNYVLGEVSARGFRPCGK